jgi:hypothetical protein
MKMCILNSGPVSKRGRDALAAGVDRFIAARVNRSITCLAKVCLHATVHDCRRTSDTAALDLLQAPARNDRLAGDAGGHICLAAAADDGPDRRSAGKKHAAASANRRVVGFPKGKYGLAAEAANDCAAGDAAGSHVLCPTKGDLRGNGRAGREEKASENASGQNIMFAIEIDDRAGCRAALDDLEGPPSTVVPYVLPPPETSCVATMNVSFTPEPKIVSVPALACVPESTPPASTCIVPP